MHVLLVEDDDLIADGIIAGLALHGFQVEWLDDGLRAQIALKDDSFDLLILDLGLPRLDGLKVLQGLRADGSVLPTLVLTARDSVEQRVEALDAGADDYLIKPFALEELAARLRALYRRPPGRPLATITHGHLILEPGSGRVVWRGQFIDLPRREFRLLEALLQGRGRTHTREWLESRVYGWDEAISSNALEVHVHALRQRFGRDLIRTVRGVGYEIEKLP